MLYLGEMNNQKKVVTFGSNASVEDTHFPYLQRQVGDSLFTDDLIDVSAPTDSRLVTKKDYHSIHTSHLINIEKVTLSIRDHERSVSRTNDLILKEISLHKRVSASVLRNDKYSDSKCVSSNLDYKPKTSKSRRFNSIGEIKLSNNKN